MLKIVFVVFVITLVGLYTMQRLDQSNRAPIDNVGNTNEIINGIKVIISGQVAKPGQYTLSVDATLNDLIIKSGGLLETADYDAINLNLLIGERKSFFIPSLGETKPCPVEKIKININNATREELQSLPSLDKSQVEAIITYRDEIADNAFETIEDIQKVPGIGVKTFENIREYITIK